MDASAVEVAAYDVSPVSSECPDKMAQYSGDESDATTAPSSRQSSARLLQTGSAFDDSSPSGDAYPTSAYEDAFDVRGIADELLEDWTDREIHSLAPIPSGVDASVLPLHVRHTALSFLSHIAQVVGLPQKSWFEASLLLDAFILKSLTPSQNLNSIELAINTLPATCVALVAILRKNECISPLGADTSCYIADACLLAQYLQGLGYTSVNAEVTEDMINKQEVKVLHTLRWRIRVPTIESWTSTFCARFNVLTRNSMVPSLTLVWQEALVAARRIMMHQASSKALPPKQLAAGLLAIGLVGARLLPLDSVRPRKMSEENWSQLYQGTQPKELHPKCVLPANHSDCLLVLLKITTGVDLAEMRAHAGLAALAMKDSLEAQDLPDTPLIGTGGPVGPVPAGCTVHHSAI